MSTVTLADAKHRLDEIIDRLAPGEEVVITRDEQPVARIVGAVSSLPGTRKLGSLQGTVQFIATDFDAPLDDFKEYMQ